MTMLVWPYKDPAEVLDFDIDWSARLGTDTIATSNWSAITTDGVLTIQSSSFTTNRSKVWVASGSSKFNYVLQNSVTTANGDTAVETVTLPVRTR
jgi:hypothetical protein